MTADIEHSTFHVSPLNWTAGEDATPFDDYDDAEAYAIQASIDDSLWGIWERTPDGPDAWELVAIVMWQEAYTK